MRNQRLTFVVLLAVCCCGWAAEGRAQEDQPNAEDRGTPDVRVGAIAGFGFPRPLAVEALIKAGDVLALGAEYGALPATTINGVQVDLWSVAGDVRLFPFGGAFFMGFRAGRQHVGANASIAMPPYGSLPETLALDSWFVNPRLGLLWTLPEGFTIGVEAGIQVPVSSSATSSLPLSLVPDAQRAIDTLATTALPTIDLLRIGLLL
jgi:hypothetical protein